MYLFSEPYLGLIGGEGGDDDYEIGQFGCSLSGCCPQFNVCDCLSCRNHITTQRRSGELVVEEEDV